MGMFDTVYTKCPKCKHGYLSVQSKAGECMLSNFHISDVPAVIAADVDGEWMSCNDCDHAQRVRIPGYAPKVIQMVLEE